MAQTMIPFDDDPITAEQIGKIQDCLAAALRKAGLRRRPFQQIIEHEVAGLTSKIVNLIRELAATKIFFRSIKAQVDASVDEIPGIAGRYQHFDPNVVKTMPRPSGVTKVLFFNLNHSVKDGDDLEKEYELRGPAVDPFTLGKVNEENPELSGVYPNVTCWRDENGNWCHMAFYEWGGARHVLIGRGMGWHAFWNFAAAHE